MISLQERKLSSIYRQLITMQERQLLSHPQIHNTVPHNETIQCHITGWLTHLAWAVALVFPCVDVPVHPPHLLHLPLRLCVSLGRKTMDERFTLTNQTLWCWGKSQKITVLLFSKISATGNEKEVKCDVIVTSSRSEHQLKCFFQTNLSFLQFSIYLNCNKN